jgi:hypothetical protein
MMHGEEFDEQLPWPLLNNRRPCGYLLLSLWHAQHAMHSVLLQCWLDHKAILQLHSFSACLLQVL